MGKKKGAKEDDNVGGKVLGAVVKLAARALTDDDTVAETLGMVAENAVPLGKKVLASQQAEADKTKDKQKQKQEGDGPVLTVGSTPYTLHLQIVSAQQLRFATSTETFCKVYVGGTAIGRGAGHRVFSTKISSMAVGMLAEWNEIVEIPVLHKQEIVSVCVYSKQAQACPSVGVVAIPLQNLVDAQVMDRLHPLSLGAEPAGHLRLQMVITPIGLHRTMSEIPVQVPMPMQASMPTTMQPPASSPAQMPTQMPMQMPMQMLMKTPTQVPMQASIPRPTTQVPMQPSSPASNGGPCMLMLRVHSAQNLVLAKSYRAFCKLFVGSTPIGRSAENHRAFTTPVCQFKTASMAQWNHKLEIPLKHRQEILSVCVYGKRDNQWPSIGTCAIGLRSIVGQLAADKMYPLMNGATEVGRIRLQLQIIGGEAPPPAVSIPPPVSIPVALPVPYTHASTAPPESTVWVTQAQSDVDPQKQWQEQERLLVQQEQAKQAQTVPVYGTAPPSIRQQQPSPSQQGLYQYPSARIEQRQLPQYGGYPDQPFYPPQPQAQSSAPSHDRNDQQYSQYPLPPDNGASKFSESRQQQPPVAQQYDQPQQGMPTYRNDSQQSAGMYPPMQPASSMQWSQQQQTPQSSSETQAMPSSTDQEQWQQQQHLGSSLEQPAYHPQQNPAMQSSMPVSNAGQTPPQAFTQQHVTMELKQENDQDLHRGPIANSDAEQLQSVQVVLTPEEQVMSCCCQSTQPTQVFDQEVVKQQEFVVVATQAPDHETLQQPPPKDQSLDPLRVSGTEPSAVSASSLTSEAVGASTHMQSNQPVDSKSSPFTASNLALMDVTHDELPSDASSDEEDAKEAEELMKRLSLLRDRHQNRRSRKSSKNMQEAPSANIMQQDKMGDIGYANNPAPAWGAENAAMQVPRPPQEALAGNVAPGTFYA